MTEEATAVVAALEAVLACCDRWKLAENWIALDTRPRPAGKVQLLVRDCCRREAVKVGAEISLDSLAPVLEAMEAARERARLSNAHNGRKSPCALKRRPDEPPAKAGAA